jgi:hypothetical protein
MPSASEVYFGGVSSAPVKSKGKSKLVIAIVAGLLVLGGLAAGSWYFFPQERTRSTLRNQSRIDQAGADQAGADQRHQPNLQSRDRHPNLGISNGR